MDNTYYYFRMKVKSGNSLFHLCLDIDFDGKEETKIRIEDKVFENFKSDKTKVFHMIVGYNYSKDELVEMNASGNFTHSLTGNFKYDNKKTQPDDYFWFSLVASSTYKTKCRILIFGQKYLFFFEPVGSLGTNPEADKIKQYNNSYKKVLIEQLDQKNELYQEEFKKSAFIPLKLVKMIKRDDLMPAIDSLSVYQYLNQGALRPIYACGPTKDDALKGLLGNISLLKRLDIIKNKVSTSHYEAKLKIDTEHFETVYGALIRNYLDGNFKKIEEHMVDEDKIKLFCAFLSPVQLETAASYYLIDQGYVPDTVSGGSVDYIDVRGRKLEDEKDIKSLQCKNYEYNQAHIATIFEPLSNRTVINNKLYLDLIIRDWLQSPGLKNGLLIKWFRIQQRIMNKPID